MKWNDAGEFICIGGTNCKAHLLTSDGTMLAMLAQRSGWVWCVRGHPKKNLVAVGSEDGSIAVYQLLFSTVHGLYHDCYAFRQVARHAEALYQSYHDGHISRQTIRQANAAMYQVNDPFVGVCSSQLLVPHQRCVFKLS